MQYEIDLRAIKAASFAMSSEETRYYLKGVCIEISAANGILAIATDGHRLIAMQAAPASQAITGDREIIIPAETVKRIKINRRFSDGILRDMGNGQWQIEHDGQIYAFQPIDGSFPAWRRVLPKHSTPGERAYFNADYVADMHKAAAIYDKDCLAIIVPDGGNPAWVNFTHETVPGFAVIMPRRVSEEHYAVNPPAWAGLQAPAQAASQADAA